MQEISKSPHISGRFNLELENLKNAVLAMGGIVEQQLADTLKALRDDDKRLAEKVVIGDDKVNDMELHIDQECMRIIARRNPIAGDLRLVLTIVKINTDVERIGDEVERVANMVVLKKFAVVGVDQSGNVQHRASDPRHDTRHVRCICANGCRRSSVDSSGRYKN